MDLVDLNSVIATLTACNKVEILVDLVDLNRDLGVFFRVRSVEILVDLVDLNPNTGQMFVANESSRSLWISWI